jgi:hypothetical protein
VLIHREGSNQNQFSLGRKYQMAEPNPKLPELSTQDIERFHGKVSKAPGQGPKGDCWEYQAGKFRRGYGAFKVKGKTLKAQRVAYFLHFKLDPGAFLTCHTCDNPPCCNPAHLFLGTLQDNVDDMVIKGRSTTGDRNGSRKHPERLRRGDNHPSKLNPETVLRGIKSPRAKLTEETVKEIWRLVFRGVGPAEISRRLLISLSTVENIKYGRVWNHVEPQNKNATTPQISTRPKGEKSSSAKLTESQVKEIRDLAANGRSLNSIAKQYKVSFPSIKAIVIRQTWKHVE